MDPEIKVWTLFSYKICNPKKFKSLAIGQVSNYWFFKNFETKFRLTKKHPRKTENRKAL